MDRQRVARMCARDSAPIADFRSGFVAMLPLWAGAIPSGMAFGVAAHAAGMSSVLAQLMSLVVFSAPGQISAVSLIEAGSPAALLVGTVIALNVQLFLLSATVARLIDSGWPGRALTAWFLTDGSFAVAAGLGQLRQRVLVGAGVSMYAAWNAGTLIGLVAGHALPNTRSLGVDFVVALAFLAVLTPLLRDRARLIAAIAAAVATVIAGLALPLGVAVLLGGSFCDTSFRTSRRLSSSGLP